MTLRKTGEFFCASNISASSRIRNFSQAVRLQSFWDEQMPFGSIERPADEKKLFANGQTTENIRINKDKTKSDRIFFILTEEQNRHMLSVQNYY